MNKTRYIFLIILLVIVGFFVGSFYEKSVNKATDKAKLGEGVIGNPVLTYITLEGKVTALDKQTITIEKDGAKIVAYLSEDSSFAKFGSTQEKQASPPATTSLKQIPVGSEVIGGGKFMQDPGTKQYRVYTTNFWVK